MHPTIPHFSGAYWWSVDNRTVEELSGVQEVPKPIADLLKNKTQATAIELTNQYKGFDNLPQGTKMQRLLLTNDRHGNHLPAESTLNPEELHKKLLRYVQNPHGILTSTKIDGLNATLKVYSPIHRFFKEIWNTVKRWFGK